MDLREKTNVPEFTVSDISQYIKRTLETEFSIVRIKGELGRISRPASGHIYFDLKDSKSVISGVVWRNTRIVERDLIEEGNEVVLVGKISSFSGQSKYQILVEGIKAAGIGALLAMLNKRREKLDKEGLFDQNKKMNLPLFPETIGVITSLSGVVIEDIITRINARFPLKVIIFPVSVQGETCATEVIGGLDFFNHARCENSQIKPDLLIVARGGGSFEDLWPFNDENLVRAVFSSQIPVISAIGHETDITLIDLVADMRAPTPSAAAELAVPDIKNLTEKIAYNGSLITNYFQRSVLSKEKLLTEKVNRLKSPTQLLQEKVQRLKFIELQLSSRVSKKVTISTARLKMKEKDLEARFKEFMTLLSARKLELSRRGDLMGENILRKFKDYMNQLSSSSKLLESVSYRKVLSRGYSVVRNEKNKVVSKRSELELDQKISIEWHDGTVNAKINE